MPFNKLPAEIIHYIADYLDYKSATNLSVGSKFFANILSNQYFIKRKDRLDYQEKLFEIIPIASSAIDSYIGGYKTNWGDYAQLDKGSKRAAGFYILLNYQEISLPFKIFSIYTLLQEKNGIYLKLKVSKALETISLNILDKVKSYLDCHYCSGEDNEFLLRMQKILLNKVHISDISEDDLQNVHWGMRTIPIGPWLNDIENETLVAAKNSSECNLM